MVVAIGPDWPISLPVWSFPMAIKNFMSFTVAFEVSAPTTLELAVNVTGCPGIMGCEADIPLHVHMAVLNSGVGVGVAFGAWQVLFIHEVQPFGTLAH